MIKGVGGLYTVRASDGELLSVRARGIFRKNGISPLVGDEVEVENDALTAILPRRNAFPRPPVANIDKLFIVCAVADPAPNLYTLDRMTVIARFLGVTPVLVFNKTDLDKHSDAVSLYSSLPIKSYSLSAAFPNEKTVEELKNEINGCTVALSGVSGVGKSTLMNLICPEARAETGEISKKLGRGKNTTRHTELFETCGGRVVDTPGFSEIEPREFGLVDRSVLPDLFPEFAEPLSDGCRFSDCRHIAEPDCALRRAVEKGRVPKTRYESFVRLYDEIGELKAWENK